SRTVLLLLAVLRRLNSRLRRLGTVIDGSRRERGSGDWCRAPDDDRPFLRNFLLHQNLIMHGRRDRFTDVAVSTGRHEAVEVVTCLCCAAKAQNHKGAPSCVYLLLTVYPG